MASLIEILQWETLPKKCSIEICKQKLTIYYVEYLELEEGLEILGAWNMNTRSIYVSELAGDWRYVLVHEIIHAILALSGADNHIKYAIEEQICQAIEIGLTPLLLGKQSKAQTKASKQLRPR